MHFTIKPVSFTCNLECDYCFYLPKGEEQGMLHKGIMSDEVLEAFIPRYIQECPSDHVLFTWQGGEPLLAGRKFFEKAFALQRQYANGKVIENAIQTNATLIDDKWCELFLKHKILLGVSIDGPAELHDKYRHSKNGGGSHSEVMQGIELLKKHGVEFNTLTCINESNYRHPLEVYKFLKDIGSTFMQFSEVIETNPENTDFDNIPQSFEPKPFSLPAKGYGEFMSAIFLEWVHNDIDKINIRQFESLISNVLGLGHLSCVFENRCPDNFVLEANGDIYECDQAVYPKYRLANILDIEKADAMPAIRCNVDGADPTAATATCSLKDLKASRLSAHKLKLSADCKECKYLSYCNGGCIKHRIVNVSGVSKTYFCEGYKQLFETMLPYLNAMVYLENQKIPYRAIKQIAPQIAAGINK
ncbi:MAG: anaerobic sulfatase maturase [Anaerobiospirillum succiniciproducens]|uniref:anaerobic sulfatase maturase n=1 Tax=Anaerobiospirillum succiniciproducens TaxID=13335 RepID=UPI002A765726|nr:anaerobic sulfatase maturase [Anaerobiospirillum succiniciproducens]MDY2797901.1 anaerobic sulfatase maturase [Anaerobiospirillum succiniciproducens]